MKKLIIAALATLALTGQAWAGHNATVGAGNCSYCHKVNLIDQHGGFGPDVCGKCHKTTATAVVTTIAAGAAGQAYACSNCHGSTSHLGKHPTYMTGYNTTAGYQPNATAIWVQPASYTTVSPAAKQYQLCYKCHSSKALGTVAGGVSGIVGPSGDNFTDQAMEFNPANKSAHPIQVAANSFTGSTAPKALTTAQVNATWSKVGTQTMQCSDCHASGSTEKFMLIAGTTWPKKADGTYWGLPDLNSSTSGWQTKLFCAKCHPLKSGSGWANEVHGKGDHSNAKCVNCHVVVPHGSKRSRLIGYATDPKPYAAYGTNGTNMSLLKGFKKASSPTGYSESNCYSTASACSDHNRSSGTWEP